MTCVLWLILAVAAQLCGASESSCTSAAELPQDGSDCSAFLQSSTRRATAPEAVVAPEKIGSGSQIKASWPGMWRPWLKRWRQQRHSYYYNVDNAPSDNGDNAPDEESTLPVALAIFLEVLPYGQGYAVQQYLNFTEDNETFGSSVTALVGLNATDCEVDFIGLDFSAFDDVSITGDAPSKLKLAQIKQASSVNVQNFDGDLLLAFIQCQLPPEASPMAVESSLESSSVAADFKSLLAGLGVSGLGQAELVDIDIGFALLQSSTRSEPEITAPTKQVSPEKIGGMSRAKALHHWFKRWMKRGRYYNADNASPDEGDGDNAPSDNGDNAPSPFEGMEVATLFIAIEVTDAQDAQDQLAPLIAGASSNVSTIFGSLCPAVGLQGFEMSAFADPGPTFKGHASLLAELKQAKNAKVQSFEGDLLLALAICLHPSETFELWKQGLETQKDLLAESFKNLLINLGLPAGDVGAAAIAGIRTDYEPE